MNHLPVVVWRPDGKVQVSVNVIDDDGNLRATRQILPPSDPSVVDAFAQALLTKLWDRAEA